MLIQRSIMISSILPPVYSIIHHQGGADALADADALAEEEALSDALELAEGDIDADADADALYT